MKDINLLELLQGLGFEYIEHRGTTDTFKSGNIEVKVPYTSIVVDGLTTHMIPSYESTNIQKVLEDKLWK